MPNSIKCERCGQNCTEAAAFLIDISMSSRGYDYKFPNECHINRRDSVVVCPTCEEQIAKQAKEYIQSFKNLLRETKKEE